MAYQATTATRKLSTLQKKIRVVAGGTSAGKTISILQILIDKAQTNPNILISVVSESFPHLRRGAIRDFLNIMQQHGYFNDRNWSQTDFTYTFSNNAKIEFFSADQPGKVRGPRRNILFVNEANNIGWEAFDQLMIRTNDTIWIDYNPTHEFWAYTELMPHFEHDFITLTYKDNEGLDSNTIERIEAHRHNKNWWRVYGEGLLGDIEGRIYTNWAIIEQIPHEARLERRGLDFGFSNDPLALIDIYKYNGGFIFDERLYRTGLHNKQVADFINNAEHAETLVYADSAEPKSIDEMVTYGVPIVPSHKGQNSINAGIGYIQDQRISVTKRSVHLIKEYRNYMWEFDKDGVQLTKPIDIDNHCMDAIRYGLESYFYHTNRESGIVTAGAIDRREKSFIVNDEGEAEAFHIDLGNALKQSEKPLERDWRYN